MYFVVTMVTSEKPNVTQRRKRFMKKTVRRMLTVCGATAMMLSAAQITAFADGDVKEVALHMPTIYDLPDAPMVEDAINQITEEKYGFI